MSQIRTFLTSLIIFFSLSTVVFAQDYSCGLISDPDGFTNVRSGPSLQDEVIDHVDSGDWVIITGKKGEFYDCMLLVPGAELPEVFGFIHKTRVRGIKKALGAGIVNDPDGWSNLRNGASSETSVITKVRPEDGFFVVLSKTSGGWYKVQTRQSQSGFLHESRLEWVIPTDS